MEGVQILLIIVIVILTLLLVVVGWQVILIIVDLRKAVKRLNNLLEDSVIGGGLLRPEKLSGIIEAVKKNKRVKSSEHGTHHR